MPVPHELGTGAESPQGAVEEIEGVAAAETDEDDDGLEYSSLLLLVPANIALTWWDHISWLAWTAIVAGALGVVLAIFTLGLSSRKGWQSPSGSPTYSSALRSPASSRRAGTT